MGYIKIYFTYYFLIITKLLHYYPAYKRIQLRPVKSAGDRADPNGPLVRKVREPFTIFDLI